MPSRNVLASGTSYRPSPALARFPWWLFHTGGSRAEAHRPLPGCRSIRGQKGEFRRGQQNCTDTTSIMHKPWQHEWWLPLWTHTSPLQFCTRQRRQEEGNLRAPEVQGLKLDVEVLQEDSLWCLTLVFTSDHLRKALGPKSSISEILFAPKCLKVSISAEENRNPADEIWVGCFSCPGPALSPSCCTGSCGR